MQVPGPRGLAGPGLPRGPGLSVGPGDLCGPGVQQLGGGADPLGHVGAGADEDGASGQLGQPGGEGRRHLGIDMHLGQRVVTEARIVLSHVQSPSHDPG